MTCMPNVSCPISLFISTHILTKRMTQHTTLIYKLFQLTSSRRGWRPDFLGCVATRHFNSHPHEEDDPANLSQSALSPYFNSHPHEEDDFVAERSRGRIEISTHILTKRMTKDWIHPIVRRILFQLTSSRRGWHRGGAVMLQLYKFQLTSSRRGWRP